MGELDHVCDDASLPFDHHHAELLLYRVALARKMSLFMWPERGESYVVAYRLWSRAVCVG